MTTAQAQYGQAMSSLPHIQKPNVVTHEDIALSFVRRYFTLMHDDPSQLHRLYSKASQYVCGVEGEAASVLVGDQAINKKLMELDLAGCNVSVSSIDSMFSVDNAVLIVALGQLHKRDGATFRFSQTVLLAPQPNGYYIPHEVFRHFKGEQHTTVEQPKSPRKPQSPVHPVAEQPTHVAQEPLPHAGETKRAEPVATKKSDEKPRMKPAAPTAPMSAKDLPPSKKTWANISAVGSEQWGEEKAAMKGTVEKNNVTAETRRPVSRNTDAPRDAQREAPRRDGGKREERAPREARPSDNAPSASVFVKNVSDAITVDDLKQAFSTFGLIRNVSVLSAKGIAFIDFESAEGAKKASEKATIDVKGQPLGIEEKRASKPQAPRNGAPSRENRPRFESKNPE